MFTGYQDRNNNEIMQGDSLIAKNGESYQAGWDERGFWVLFSPGGGWAPMNDFVSGLTILKDE